MRLPLASKPPISLPTFTRFLICLIGVSTGAHSHAAILNVPSQHPTIPIAVLNASNGDEIVVSPGTYAGGIDFLGKDLTLRSTGGSQVTILDGGNTQRLLMMIMGETGEVSGFTFKDGYSPHTFGDSLGGPAILVLDGHLALSDCVFVGNHTDSSSAMKVSCENGGSPTVDMTDCYFLSNTADYNAALSIFGPTVLTAKRCVFEKNLALGDALFPLNSSGGAFHLEGNTDATFTDCAFIDNQCPGTSGSGGAITMGGNANLELVRCRIRGNTVSGEGGFMTVSGGTVTIRDSEFVDNAAGSGSVVHALANPSVFFDGCTFAGHTAELLALFPGQSNPNFEVRNSIVWGNSGGLASQLTPVTVSWSNVQNVHPGVGNISIDPQFSNPVGGDYSLAPTSPCIDMGDPSVAPTTITIDTDPRFLDGDLNGSRRIDMGADEWNPIHLDIADTPTGLQFDLSGAPSSTNFLIAGPPGELAVPGVGTLFISAPLVLVPWAPTPSSIAVPLPGPIFAPFNVHAIAAFGTDVIPSNRVSLIP